MYSKFLIFLYLTVLSNLGFTQEKSIIAEGAELTLVSSNFEFTEGPAADSLGNVYFTDQPNNRIHKWSAQDNSVTVYMEDAGRSNGLYFDNEGRLLACADEKSQLWRIDKNKDITVLLDDYEGKRFNGPNDLWVDKKGGIYFTDPYYQRPYWDRTEKEIEKEMVYYLTPDGEEIKVVVKDFTKPNGIIGTPDGKTLYIADIGAKETFSYTINEDGTLSNKTLFANMGSDGMTIDNMGNIYLTGDGVTVFNKEGKQIEHIPVDQQWTANITFGGLDRKTLFITAMNSVYVLKMNVRGVE